MHKIPINVINKGFIYILCNILNFDILSHFKKTETGFELHAKCWLQRTHLLRWNMIAVLLVNMASHQWSHDRCMTYQHLTSCATKQAHYSIKEQQNLVKCWHSRCWTHLKSNNKLSLSSLVPRVVITVNSSTIVELSKTSMPQSRESVLA
jgi:hypothetical protein